MQTIRLLAFALASGLLAQEPCAFLPNHGQWPAQVRAGVRHGAMTTWLTDTGWTTQVGACDEDPDPRGGDGIGRAAPVHMAVVAVELVGGSGAVDVLGARLPGTVGFWLDNDPRRHAPAVPRHDGALRAGVWPGIDLEFETRAGQLAYDLHVAAGVDAAVARFAVRGQKGLSLDANGALVLDVGFGTLRHEPPRAWQIGAGGEEHSLPARFVLLGEGQFGFAVDGRDAQRPLVIDPLLTWVTRLGGSSNDWPGGRQAIDRAPDGRVVVCGQTFSFNFPVTNGSSLVGGRDGCLTVLDASGVLQFSTFLGGSGATGFGNDAIHGVRWDGSGSLCFCGWSSSINLPTTPGCYQTGFAGGTVNGAGDMIVGRFDPAPAPAGSFALGYLTYIGGTADENANALAALPGGQIAVVGPSASAAPSGGFDGILAVLDPNQLGAVQLVTSTWLGGNGDDIPQSLLVDANGNLVVGGWTASTAGFPVTGNALQTSYQGGAMDGFVAIYAPSFASLNYCTFIGGIGAEEADDIAFDSQGRLAIGSWVGGTTGFSFPLPGGLPGGPFPTPRGGTYDGYALLLDPTRPPLQQVVWGTYLGGSGYEGVHGIAVDSADRIVVVGPVRGVSGVTNFPSTSWTLPFIGGPTGPFGGQWDSYVARFDRRQTGTEQLTFATFLGGTGYDYAFDVVLDERSRAITTGLTSSNPFLGASSFGGEDFFVVKVDMLATVADRGGAPSPSCANVVLDAYHQQLSAGFKFTLTASNAPPMGFGILLVGAPDFVGTPLPFGFTAYLDVLQPVASVAVLVPDPLGFTSLSGSTTAAAPTGVGVQALFFGGCAPFVASDMLRL